MFDIDSLDPFLGAGQQPRQAKQAEPDGRTTEANGRPAGAPGPAGKDAAAPKSREERLREFYAKREQEVAPVQSVEPEGDAEAEAMKMKKKGNDQYQAGDYEAAVEFYTTAIKTASSSVLHANRAAAYMMLGWWQQALRDTKAALRKDPDNNKALERQGKVQLALDDLDGALKAAAELEARIPEEEKLAMKKPPANIRRLRWLAQNAANPQTLEECRAVIAEFGSKAELNSPLGIRLRKTLSKVLVERSDAIDNQRKIRPALAKNRITERDGDEIQEITPFAEEAIKITGELLEDNPDDAEVRYLRGRALVRLGRHNDAEAQLKRGLRDEPEHAQMKELVETINSLDDLKVKGNTFYKEGKLNEAIHMYTMGIDQDPACLDTRTVATLHYNRSAAHRKKGEFEKALDDVDTSLALHPKWCKALYRRGVLLLECGRPAEALTELKVVQRADPTFDDDLEVWLRRAHNWMSKPRDEFNYYKFMRLPMDSSKDDIRKQYRRLCLLWHPDKNGGTESGRQRFEELQTAYKFLMDDEQRVRYDFGIWKDKPVRHHVKVRQKVKDSYDDSLREEDNAPERDRHLEEDSKVESIYWGDGGCPAWLKERRKQIHRQRYGEDPDSDEP
mmetsp:Transcript_110852/g.357823  ORF Transcript_110852/g.357823 Transcript_110852/m.357823 type:complete len:619 (+) Transcript_110852:69-1925(+)